MTSFAEVTMLSHGHGGKGWELGTCLWCPTATTSSQDRYAIMRVPKVGDRVYHWVAGVHASKPRQRFLWGRSLVAVTVATINHEPPSPGDWAGRGSYYRIELKQYEELTSPLRMDEIENGLFDLIMREAGPMRPKHYPYVQYQDHFRVAQGIYLTLLTNQLAEGFDELFSSIDLESPSSEFGSGASNVARSYTEGERTMRETTFFRRNPALRRAAIERHGCACAVCGFDFGAIYGPLGSGFIEVHHLNPLAERRDLAFGKLVETTVEDVVPLCSNCHRMAHRQRPAITMDALKALRGQSPFRPTDCT